MVASSPQAPRSASATAFSRSSKKALASGPWMASSRKRRRASTPLGPATSRRSPWHSAAPLAAPSRTRASEPSSAARWARSAPSMASRHVSATTYSHAPLMLGTTPSVLSAATYCSASTASVGPVRSTPYSRLRGASPRSRACRSRMPLTNSGRSWSEQRVTAWRTDSSSAAGRTRVTQARLGKSVRIAARTRFRSSERRELSGRASSARSMYSSWEMGFPSATRSTTKSRSTHTSGGKNCARSASAAAAAAPSPPSETAAAASARTHTCLDSSEMRKRRSMAASSRTPMELSTK
mmetsp:Transcript_27304/g.91363  ORF Transcript_27304/g.91363 Transcript_27304/m.91363 type:complete len:295 (-) Transcript_27304:473-1357(-)